MLHWINPVDGSDYGLWLAGNMGYVEQIMGEFALRLYDTPYSTEAGRYATLESAKAAAELIYSTRSA